LCFTVFFSLRGLFPTGDLQRVETLAQLYKPFDRQTRKRHQSRRARYFIAHPRRNQRERAVRLDDDQMLRTGKSPAAYNLNQMVETRMKRVVNDGFIRQTPGIVTLPRPASARAGSPAR
jgi:hypothetical protein